MEKKFTIDEFEDMFNKLVIKSDRHGQSIYQTLDGEYHSVDMRYLIAGMRYFLQDLRAYTKDRNDTESIRHRTLLEVIDNDEDLRKNIVNHRIHYCNLYLIDGDKVELIDSVQTNTLAITVRDLKEVFKRFLDLPVNNYYFLGGNAPYDPVILNFNLLRRS